MRIPIRFEPFYAALSSALLVSPSRSYIELGDTDVEVRMGWAFRARFPRAAVRAPVRLARRVLSRGVHGWRGEWLVNGAGDRLLVFDLEPVQRARVLGVPVRLRRLYLSVDDPDEVAQRLRRT